MRRRRPRRSHNTEPNDYHSTTHPASNKLGGNYTVALIGRSWFMAKSGLWRHVSHRSAPIIGLQESLSPSGNHGSKIPTLGGRK